MPALVILVATGCVPGHIEWESGDDILRTALYLRDAEDGADHALLFLSNGIFHCDLPEFDDEIEGSIVLAELVTAACREDARHLFIDLYKRPDATWQGLWPESATASASALTEETPRLVEVYYVGIEDAHVTRPSGLVPVHHPTLVTQYSSRTSDLSGEVEVTRHGNALHGRFSFPDAHISGRFTAQECPADSATLAALAIQQDPINRCP